MSYTLIPGGLGATAFETVGNSYVSGGLPAALSTANDRATDSALASLKVSANYVGPIRQGEQAIFNEMSNAIQAGRMPSGSAIANTLLQTGAAVGATAACAASPIAPAAPLCGMIASKLVGEIAGLFSGSSKCSPRIHEVCATEVYANYRAAVLKECAQGDDACRAQVNKTIDEWIDAWRNGLVQNASAMVARPFGYLETPAEKAKKDLYFYALNQVGNFPALGKKILPITMKSRVNAEIAFMDSVKSASAQLQAPYVAACPSGDPGCRQITGGLMGEAAYESAMALRQTGDQSAVTYILKNAHAQANGALANALDKARDKNASIQAALDTLNKNAKIQRDASSASGLKTLQDIQSADDAKALQQSTRRKVAVGAVAATVVGAFAILRFRKNHRL